MKMAIRVLMIILAFALTASFAHADTVVYSFVGQSLNGPASFTLTVSAPLDDTETGATGRFGFPDFSFFPGPNLVCNGCLSFFPGPDLVCNGCALIDFFKDVPAPGSPFQNAPNDVFGFQTPSGGLTNAETFFYFDHNAVLTDGTHSTIGRVNSINSGTLTVSGVNAQVPEPPLLSLLVAGLTVLGGLTYSQRTSVSSNSMFRL
jgi:hypothetical protein